MNAEPQAKKYPRVAAELLLLFLLFVCVAVPFQQTIFSGTPISKIGMLEAMDAVQAPSLYTPWCITDDLSTSMAHIPNEYFVQAQAASGELPLWNPLNGGGRPFAGEFQTLQFSFFHQVFPANSSYAYNLGLVFKVLLSAFGAFFLARRAGLSLWSALAAGVAYAFCPHCLRFTELVDNYCFYPWLALAFVWFGSAPSLLRAVLAGLLTAAAAYNMHPETFACAAALASAFGFVRMFDAQNHSSTGSVGGSPASRTGGVLNSLRPLPWIALIAFIAFCAAAPLVLPLAEFIANGSSYKFASHQIEHIQFKDFLLNLFSSSGSGSTYIGIGLGLTLPLGMLCWGKRSPILLALLFGILLFSTRPFGLESLLSLKPFCYLLPEYTLYAALLLVCICAGSGLDELFGAGETRVLSSKLRSICIGVTAASAGIVLLSQLPQVANALPRISDFLLGTEEAVLTTAALILTFVFAAAGFLPERFSALRRCGLILISLSNCLILACLVSRELGPREAFEYTHNQITKQLQSLDGRVIATGYNLFQPNTNLVYGVEDFRSTAPLFPSRYSEFLALGNAGAKFCTIPEAPSKLNHIFDLASVKYILSDRALGRTQIPDQDKPVLLEARKLANGLRLERASSGFNSDRRELFAKATFTVHNIAEGHYSAALAATLADGKLLAPIRWLNDRLEVIGVGEGKHQYSVSYTLPISKQIAAGSKVSARLLVRDNWSAKVVEDIALQDFVIPETSALDTNPQVNLARLQELSGALYLYENKNSMPPAYVASYFEIVKTPGESLQFVSAKSSSPDWNQTVVIEDASGKLASSKPNSTSSGANSARILDRSADSVLVLTNADRPGWLVLNDTFYPGWEAKVDSTPARIYPANHMFRAVQIPPGHHIITFEYKPASFAWGCRLLQFILVASVIILIASLWQSRFPKSKSSDPIKEREKAIA